MGRSSSTGYPFLIQRIDAGQFTYHREILALLAPLVVGDLLLPWCGRKRALSGKKIIRVSLATGDEKTARQRWAAVHPQVDALVQMAELRTRVHGRADSTAEVPHLGPISIRTIANQAYYDVLAADDQIEVEQCVSPLAKVLLGIAQSSALPGSESAIVAERAARRIEQRMHEERIRRRKTWLLDTRIVEEELDGDAAGILKADVSKGSLAPEQIEALAHGIRIGEIESEVEQRLRENGLDLPPGHADRRAVALAITRAKLRGLHDVSRRDRGAPIDTPLRPDVLVPDTASEMPVPRLSAMPDRWIAMKRPKDKQIGDCNRYMRLFTAMHGDLPVDKITGHHVRAFRDALLECPRDTPLHLATASVAELSAWAKSNPSKRKLGRGTINAKGVGTIATMLKQAVLDEYIRSNPAEGQQLPIDESDKQDRRPYSADELKQVFTTAIYDVEPKIPTAGKGYAAFWLPLLGLYTGARLEELGQALVSDVRAKDDIDYLEVTTLADDFDDSVSKSLKTISSRRRIPLHATLIRLGFLDYVQAMRVKGAKRLFPDLEKYRGRVTKNWSRWWGRWLNKLALIDPSLTYHSFRHSFTSELRRTRCNPSIMKELLGHTQSDTTSGYGRIAGHLHELDELNGELQRITFPGLQIADLVPLRSWHET